MKPTAVFLDTGQSSVMGGMRQTRIGREEIGAQLVAACVEHAGWNIRFLRPNTADINKIEAVIKEGACDALVFFPYTYTKHIADKAAERFKGHIPIIYGGNHAGVGSVSKTVLKEGRADYVIHGRGEEALPRLLKDIEHGNPRSKIYHHRNSDILFYSSYPLDALPMPFRDELLMQNLESEPLPFLAPLSLVSKPKRCIIVAGSLGCDARCDFCSSWMIAPRSMHRSPRSLVDEMEFLEMRYGPGIIFHMANPLFNADREWVMETCREMERRGPFPTICMPDFCLDAEMVQVMKRAGIFMVMMGLEFVNTETRTARGKRIGDPKKAYDLCDEAGIITRAFLMLGRLGMSKKDLEEETQMLHSLPFRADQVRINFEVPFPGSVIASKLSSGDIIADQSVMTTESVVYRTELSAEEWQEARLKIMFDYHHSESQKRHYEKKIKKHPELEMPIRNFLERIKCD